MRRYFATFAWRAKWLRSVLAAEATKYRMRHGLPSQFWKTLRTSVKNAILWQPRIKLSNTSLITDLKAFWSNVQWTAVKDYWKASSETIWLQEKALIQIISSAENTCYTAMIVKKASLRKTSLATSVSFWDRKIIIKRLWRSWLRRENAIVWSKTDLRCSKSSSPREIIYLFKAETSPSLENRMTSEVFLLMILWEEKSKVLFGP